MTEKRGTVYITQEIMKRDLATGNMMPTMDFRKAAEYGDLVLCLPTGRMSLTPGPTVQILKEKLKNFDDSSYLVAVGDPSVIAMAGAIAANNNMGRFKMLKWDRDAKNYISVSVDLWHRTRANNSEN
jgi:hypothetical protein